MRGGDALFRRSQRVDELDIGNRVAFQHGCVTKICYTSKRLATGSIRVMKRRLGIAPQDESLVPYHCRTCHHWHVGNTSRQHTTAARQAYERGPNGNGSNGNGSGH